MKASSDIDLIVQYFLYLYRLQLGVVDMQEKNAESRSLPPVGLDPHHIYELRVKHQGKWKSRRMSIAPLGEPALSKSMCYKVVYDDNLVVKIPPTPVKDFDEYISAINLERRILERLTPSIECVSPNVSVMLKRIPRFQDKKGLGLQQLEEKYVKELKRSHGSQSYLKIGPTFIFFMGLSKHPFFSDILDNMHVAPDQLQDEIIKKGDALRNLETFKAVFGTGHDAVFFDVNKVYNLYDKKISRLLDQYGIASAGPAYKRHEWFVYSLAQKEIEDESDFPEDFISHRNMLTKKIFGEGREVIDHYLHLVKTYLSMRNFDMNRSYVLGIIVNFLNLLHKLRMRGVALRDLKAANVFVVASADDPFHYLALPEEYSLGLIDLETAVIYETDERNDIDQPELAGTPAYATPSHLFENEILRRVLCDYARILYLQDWFAAVGIIYHVVTGETLFEKTGDLLFEIMRLKQKAISKNQSLEEVFKHCSWVFWQSATQTFIRNVSAHEAPLKTLKVAIDDDIAKMFQEEIQRGKTVMLRMIRESIENSDFFKMSKEKQDQVMSYLMKASYEDILRYQSKWEEGINIPETSTGSKDTIIKWLRALAELKFQLKQITALEDAFVQTVPQMSVYDLLHFLFRIVFHAMYIRAWADREHPQLP